jgi:hypothetical protein
VSWSRCSWAVDYRGGSTPAASGAEVLALHVAALIFLGTFLVANNFDYRLVFLLLALPPLAAWARTPRHPLAGLASVTLVSVLVLLWVGSLSQRLHLWDELVTWAVAGLLGAMVLATIPHAREVVATAAGRRAGSERGAS